MALQQADWESIYNAIRTTIPAHEVTYGKVVKRDARKKLVWLSEYGDQPIPIVAFNQTVTIHDETPTGIKVKTVKIDVEVPKVGELVVVLRQMGERRLPKCIGVVQGKGFVT